MHRVEERSESREKESLCHNLTVLLFSSSSKQEPSTAALLEVGSDEHFQLHHHSYVFGPS